MQIVSEEQIQDKWVEAVKGTVYEDFMYRTAPFVIKVVRWVEAQLLSGHGGKQSANNTEHVIGCTSGFGLNTQKPFVGLELDGELLAQIPPESARSLAYGLLVSAEAAEQDAFMMGFVQKELGGTQEMAAGILGAYRLWREENV